MEDDEVMIMSDEESYTKFTSYEEELIVEDEPVTYRKNTNNNKLNNLPWVEKYRPQELKDVVSHTDVIVSIRSCIENDQLPHLLFHGPPGTGKTSTILAIARDIYKEYFSSDVVLEKNASDDRGIDTIREVKEFVRSGGFSGWEGFKLVILDEADSLTFEAQQALRKVMEENVQFARFCIICNHRSKITAAIQSRCTNYRFKPIPTKHAIGMIEQISQRENLQYERDALVALLELNRGDLRKSVNTLQQCAMLNDNTVTVENIYKIMERLKPEEIHSLVKTLYDGDFTSSYRYVLELLKSGKALQDIITQVHRFVAEGNFTLSKEAKIHMYVKLSDIEERLADGCNEKTNSGTFVSVFHTMKTSNCLEGLTNIQIENKI